MILRVINRILIHSAIGMILLSCATDPDYASQFRFPIIKGDLENGKQSFVALGCNQCHSVNGVDLPAYAGESPLVFELGGKIWYVKTYGELVTSIINPDHIISREYLEKLPQGSRKDIISPMPFKENMTVSQLIDIVAFLNSRYVFMKDYSPY